MGLDLTGFGAAFDFASKVIDRIIPDPAAKLAATQHLVDMQQAGELAQLAADTDLAKGQISVDLAEANNTNLFVSGWRPFIGWVCGSALAYQFIFSPLFSWGVKLLGKTIEAPVLDTGQLNTILMGMLGLGAMRTVEKVKGINAGH